MEIVMQAKSFLCLPNVNIVADKYLWFKGKSGSSNKKTSDF